MTFAPGKRQPHGSTGAWDRDLRLDLARLREVYRTDTLVSLVEDRELKVLQIADLVSAAREVGIAVIRFPIADVSVPISISDTVALVDSIVSELSEQRTVVVHCMGGLGRTGLVVGCVLTSLGATAEEAITGVRSVRRGAVETTEQETFVRRFGARLVR